jgi:ATP-dependent DNA helicase RecQ
MIKIDYNKFFKEFFEDEKNELKEKQIEILKCIIEEKRDCLGILSTGYGKSICYQLPCFILKKTVIVISPLISLMEDQKQKLKKVKIDVCCMNNKLTYEEKKIYETEVLEGKNMLMYVTPEYFNNNELFIKLLNKNNRIGLIAIDECHCIIEWGNNFRPEYLKLSNIKKWNINVPILGLTGTATNDIQNKIIDNLKLEKPMIINNSFDRNNLNLFTKYIQKPKDIINSIIPLLDKNKSIIIYAREKADTEFIYSKIKHIIKCNYYHSDIDLDKRYIIQNEFSNGEIKCIISTIAFGMGIDKDVNIIIHYGLPDCIESYWQEIGRSGRDGEEAHCYLFYTFKDFKIHESNINKINNNTIKEIRILKLNEIKKYANIKYYCKRKQLYKYFNETYPEKYKNGCNKCVYCISKNNTKGCDNIIYKKNEYLDINENIIDLKKNKLCGMLNSDGKNNCKNKVKKDNEKCYIHKLKSIKIE